MHITLLLFAPTLVCAGWTRPPPHAVQAKTAPMLGAFERSVMAVGKEAILSAGKVIIEGSRRFNLDTGVISKQGSRDILTEYDTKSQEVIRSTIAAAFPSHKFLGEEDVPPGRDAATAAIAALCNEEHLWIVDPIDGTTNFAHSMPLSGTIIAYCSKGVCLFGLIYDPFRDELFSAWKGQGAFMNGEKISVCNTEKIADAVVCTGSPPNTDSLNACLRAMNLISSEVRTVRLLGSAAIMLAWVACGRVTSYFEADMHVWDIAAGSLIIDEAGGKVTDVFGNPTSLTNRNLVSTNGKIHEELLKRLIEAKMYLTPGIK